MISLFFSENINRSYLNLSALDKYRFNRLIYTGSFHGSIKGWLWCRGCKKRIEVLSFIEVIDEMEIIFRIRLICILSVWCSDIWIEIKLFKLRMLFMLKIGLRQIESFYLDSFFRIRSVYVSIIRQLLNSRISKGEFDRRFITDRLMDRLVEGLCLLEIFCLCKVHFNREIYNLITMILFLPFLKFIFFPLQIFYYIIFVIENQQMIYLFYYLKT